MSFLNLRDDLAQRGLLDAEQQIRQRTVSGRQLTAVCVKLSGLRDDV